jgi:RNA polymerase sigma factor (TIGR02999 family)
MSSDVTVLLGNVAYGNRGATDRLLQVVYEELRKKAAFYMSQQRPDHTLQATALVHEAYARLVGNDAVAFQNRKHFYYAAAQAMRQILVDHARRNNSDKKGGGRERVQLEAVDVPVEPQNGGGWITSCWTRR